MSKKIVLSCCGKVGILIKSVVVYKKHKSYKDRKIVASGQPSGDYINKQTLHIHIVDEILLYYNIIIIFNNKMNLFHFISNISILYFDYSLLRTLFLYLRY